MTDKDKDLIREAESLSYSQWYIASDLAKQTDTSEARDVIAHIAAYLYHLDEYYAGML